MKKNSFFTLKPQKRHPRIASTQSLIHAKRDWWIGLMLFATIVFLGSIVLARLYYIHESIDALEGAEAEQIPRYHEDIVANVLKLYRTRTERYESMRATEPVAIIPVASSTASTTSTETVTSGIEEEL